MANSISKIKIPSGTVYEVKDDTSRGGIIDLRSKIDNLNSVVGASIERREGSATSTYGGTVTILSGIRLKANGVYKMTATLNRSISDQPVVVELKKSDGTVYQSVTIPVGETTTESAMFGNIGNTDLENCYVTFRNPSGLVNSLTCTVVIDTAVAKPVDNISKKLDKPSTEGTAGQVVASDGNGGTEWVNMVEVSAEATQLPEGSSPTVTSALVSGAPKLTFGIPAGATGRQGDKGERGDTVVIAKDYADLTFPVYAGKTYCYYDNKPYVANTDIATSEAWTAAHWDEVSFEDEIGDLKSAFDEYGAQNLQDFVNGTYYPGAFTLVYLGNHVDITGSPAGSGFTHSSLYNNASVFPDGIHPGQTIQLAQNCDDANVHFRFIECINDTQNMVVDIAGTGVAQHTISEDATGCIIRYSFANGNSYDHVKSTYYIFTTLTKQQIENAITENTARIKGAETSCEAIAELMPRDYVSVEVAASEGLVNKWNQIASTGGYAYIKQAVVEGEKYKVGGYCYGGNYPAYLILNGSSVLSFYNPTTTGAFNGVEVTIQQNATHIVVNGYTSNPASIAKYDMVKAGIGGAKSFDSILVGVGAEYAYNDINSAVVENPTSIISVDYGTYDTEIENIATDKQLIGKDKNLCVLFGTGRNYDTPPIEISGGIVKHFTVNMVNAEGAAHAGYCLHSDTSACIGKTLIVEDCKFVCTGQHAIGMGIWQDENVLYKDCEFIFKDEETTPATAPFFAHNSGTSDGVAIVRFHNCIFRGSGYALKLSSYSSNCTMQFEFIDCTFESDTLTGDDMVWTDYVSGDTHDQSNLHRFKGKMPLMKTSHGNNVSIANYAT